MKNANYYLGMSLTCLLAMALIPLFIVVVGFIRFFVLLFDAVSLPYAAMVEYDRSFHEKKILLEEIGDNRLN